MSQAQLLPTDHFSPSVTLHHGRPATTSLAIAEHFGKQHKDVLKSIRNLCAELPDEIRGRNFALTSRAIAGPNNSERQEEFFIVYFDGFILLVMGYTGKRALQIKLLYIAAFNAMRDELAAQREAALPEEPTSDTLTPEQQAQLQAIVQAKMGMLPKAVQRKAYKEVWSRFNNNFQIARYAQLPPAKMGEAVEYLVGMEVKATKALPDRHGFDLEQSRLISAAIPPTAAELTTIPPEVDKLPDTRLLLRDIRRAAECLEPVENWTHLSVRFELGGAAQSAARHAVDMHVNAAWYALGLARSALLAAVAVGKIA